MQVGAIVVYEQVRLEARTLTRTASCEASGSARAPLVRLDERIFLAQLVLRAVRLNDAFHAAAASLLLGHGTVHELSPADQRNSTLKQRQSGNPRLERLPSCGLSQIGLLTPDGHTISDSDRSGRGSFRMQHLSANLVTPVMSAIQRMSSRCPATPLPPDHHSLPRKGQQAARPCFQATTPSPHLGRRAARCLHPP